MDNNTCGIIRTYHFNGKLKEEYFQNNGLKEGIYKSFHQNGEPFKEIEYFNGVRHGKTKLYRQNKLYYEVDNVNGKLHGKYIQYDANGKVVLITNYVDGQIGEQTMQLNGFSVTL